MRRNMKICKKIIVLFLCFLLSVSLCGCGQPVYQEGEQKENPPMFTVVEHTSTWCVVYHRDTKVMYAVSYGDYNGGNFTLLVNADGTPMLWGD